MFSLDNVAEASETAGGRRLGAQLHHLLPATGRLEGSEGTC